MWQFVHDYWAVVAIAAGTYAFLSCASGVVAFGVTAVREPQTVAKAAGKFRRMLTGR
jgi:hypothetical protein